MPKRLFLHQGRLLDATDSARRRTDLTESTSSEDRVPSDSEVDARRGLTMRDFRGEADFFGVVSASLLLALWTLLGFTFSMRTIGLEYCGTTELSFVSATFLAGDDSLEDEIKSEPQLETAVELCGLSDGAEEYTDPDEDVDSRRHLLRGSSKSDPEQLDCS